MTERPPKKWRKKTAALFAERMAARGIEPIEYIVGQKYSGPGKIVVFVGARGFGEDAMDFYLHPQDYGLGDIEMIGMLERCAAAWEWESAKELDQAVDQNLGRSARSLPNTEACQ